MLSKFMDNFRSKEFEIKPQMIVGTLKKQFEEVFTFPIRVYHGSIFADDSKTLAQIRKNDFKGSADAKIKMNMTVKQAENIFLNSMGIKVQICDKKGELADDNMTLGDLARS